MREVFYTGGSLGCEKKVILWAVVKQAAAGKQSRQQHIRPSSVQPAVSIRRCVLARAHYLSPTILSLQFVSLTAGASVTGWFGPQTGGGGERGGGHTVTDVYKRIHLFLQARPRLAKTLPRAMGYFLMNYISELEMKGLCVGQKHIAEGPEGRLHVVRLFV